MSFYKSAEDFYNEMTSTIKDVDTSEHSLIYKSNMPISMELSYNSMLMDELEKKIYAKSALDNKYYDNLIKRCADMGIERNLADYASGLVTFRGTSGVTIQKNFSVATKDGRWYSTYAPVTIDSNGVAKVVVTASEKGSSYNVSVGEICSIVTEYKGVDSVTNEEEISNGTNDETYEHLYNRYDSRMKEVITSGNPNYYKLKAQEVDGVGNVIVHECMNANKENKEGNVLLIISNSNNRKADASLIAKVEEHLEQNRFVGCKINVISVEELIINVSCKIDTESNIDTVKTNIISALNTYFNKLDSKTKYISVSKINAIITNSDSNISDVSELTLNNSISNINISEGHIPVVGTITISKVV